MKWVNEIKLVDSNQPATLQMLEFSQRTGQRLHPDPSISTFHKEVGPKLARDYVPARIDQAILPVRVEQWLLDGKLTYRVVGITWGGTQRSDELKIRFRHRGNDPDYRTDPLLQSEHESRPVRYLDARVAAEKEGSLPSRRATGRLGNSSEEAAPNTLRSPAAEAWDTSRRIVFIDQV